MAVNLTNEENFINESINQSRLNFVFGYYSQLTLLRDYVDRNIENKITLEAAADEVGMSSSRLSHFFIEKTGISFSNWLRHQRIRKAIELLTTQNLSITVVAMLVGYENIRTFQRSFKNATGRSPSKFRQSACSQKMSRI